MFTQEQLQQVAGATAYDSTGDKLGSVGQVFVDDTSGEPEFITVNTGMFGTKENYIPVQNARIEGDRVTVGFDKATIKDAPKVDVDGGHLDAAEEQRLYEYYGLAYGGTSGSGYADASYDTATTGTATTGTAAAGTDYTAGTDVSGPETDQAMTRSEEHLTAGTTTQEAGRVRLRKYVTTDTESVTVPVRKEHAVLTTEPVTDATLGAATDGPAISEEEHEVTLHEERAVADTVVEPVERVALGTGTVVEQETVSGEVRQENIEVEGDVDDRRV